MTGNTSICNTSKIYFRRLEALFCGVWPSPDFSLLSSRISLQNRKKCRLEPTFKKACPARLSERKSLISSGFRRVRGLQKRPQNGHPRHSCIKDSKSVCEQSHMGSNPILSAKKVQQTQGFAGLSFFVRLLEFSDFRVRTALELAVFALEQRVFLVKNPGSNPVLLFCPARLHFPSGSRNHLTSEGAFPAPWPAPRIFWICSRDGHKY